MNASKPANRIKDMPATYHICVQGRLDISWQEWFDGMDLDFNTPGFTVMVGKILDQSALHGVLAKIRDLGLILVSLTRIR